MAHKIFGELHSMGHSIMKRWDELKRGDSIADVASKWYVSPNASRPTNKGLKSFFEFKFRWHSVVRKVSNTNETFNELVDKFGGEKIKSFTTSAANMIKSIVKPSVNKDHELTESEVVVPKEAEAKLKEMAKEFKA